MQKMRTFTAHSFPARVRRIFRLANPPAWAGPATVVLGIIAAALEGSGLFLFIPLLQSMGVDATRPSGLEKFFDHLLKPIPENYVTVVLVGLLCLTILLKNVISIFTVGMTSYIGGFVAHRLRSRLFDQTISSCVDYRVTNKQSDMVATLTENSWKVSTALGLCYRLIISGCTVVIFIALMMLISIKLMLVATAFLALTALVIRSATRHASATGSAVVDENKKFGLRMWESINALQLIRAFGLERYEQHRFDLISNDVRKRLLKLDVLWAIPGPLSEISITLLIGVLIVIAQPAGIGVAAIAAFLSLLYRLQGPTRELLQSKVAVDSLEAAVDDVADFLQSTQQPLLAEGTLIAPPIERGLELHNVSFRYAADEPWALRNISISIPAGKTTAIVGQSGAGKSTLMALLFRFQDPSEGTITADGIPLPQFQLSSWRQHLALMSQDVQLFNDTIEANIHYGDLDADFDAIRNAAQIAHADVFIEALPDGYKTLVGDRGMRLSGGQRQRIALARTILRRPDILLLDEATNALDVESERAFQLALDQYTHNRTVVVIAHRLATVERADQIIVMERGRIVESGSPAQLIDRNGHFARMHNLQNGPVQNSASQNDSSQNGALQNSAAVVRAVE